MNLITLTNITTLLASAGGGGSSSSSDGDGGGSIVGVITLVTYCPFLKWGKKYRTKFKQDRNEGDYASGQTMVWTGVGVVSVVAVILTVVLSMAIESWFIGIFYSGFPLILGAVLGAGHGLYGWFDKIKPNKIVQANLAQAATKDQVWNEDYLKRGAQNIYEHFQADWSNFNLANIKTYTTPYYYQHVELMLLALYQMNRRNVTTIKAIDAIEINSMNDADDDSQDTFVAGVSAQLDDRLLDNRTGQQIYDWQTTDDSAAEYWQFQRDGNSWRLCGINPLTADVSTKEAQIQQFAQSANAYYSLDWGRLLIPQRGQLFSGASFAVSDINNHVIGKLVDTGRTYADGIIYQIYTYSEKPANDGGKIYLVGQITVPKYYDNIVIRRRKGMFQGKISSLQEISLEWADFNRKFQVFASKPEQITSFELLNPQMMQWIEAAPFEINIEVVDNSIYFYAPMSSANSMTAENYKTMLGILQGAYRELKL